MTTVRRLGRMPRSTEPEPWTTPEAQAPNPELTDRRGEVERVFALAAEIQGAQDRQAEDIRNLTYDPIWGSTSGPYQPADNWGRSMPLPAQAPPQPSRGWHDRKK